MGRKTSSGSDNKQVLIDKLISTSSKDAPLTETKYQKIVDGASQLLFKQGYHMTTIREISQACNMSMGQLYHYISTKDDILFLVHKQMQKIWYEQLINSGIEKIENPLQRLIGALRYTLEFIVENKKMVQFVYSESKYMEKRHLEVVLRMDDQNVVGFFRRLLKDVKKQNSSKEDIDFLASIVTYLTAFIALRGWNLKNKPTEKNIDPIINFILRGIGCHNP